MKIYVRGAEKLTSKQRVRIAKNSTDAEQLSSMASDNSGLVKVEVLNNPHTPEHIKQQICSQNLNSRSTDLRCAIARFTDDKTIIRKLADDPDRWVRIIIAERTDDPALIEKLSHDEDSLVRLYVAGANKDDYDILVNFIDDPSVVVREHVAQETTDMDILAMFADDVDPRVRWEVARRTDDPDIIVKLSDDPDTHVRKVAQLNASRHGIEL